MFNNSILVLSILPLLGACSMEEGYYHRDYGPSVQVETPYVSQNVHKHPNTYPRHEVNKYVEHPTHYGHQDTYDIREARKSNTHGHD